MTLKDEEPRSSFKVVDRRRFNSEGEVRADAPPDQPRAEPPPPQPAPAPKAAAAAEKPAPQKGAAPEDAPKAKEGPQDAASEAASELFLGFIQSLGQQALMQLGVVPYPDTGLVEQSLPAARQTIDILAVMALKTRGNLNAKEARFMDMLLQDLRMAYVQMTEAAMQKAMPPELRKGPPGARR